MTNDNNTSPSGDDDLPLRARVTPDGIVRLFRRADPSLFKDIETPEEFRRSQLEAYRGDAELWRAVLLRDARKEELANEIACKVNAVARELWPDTPGLGDNRTFVAEDTLAMVIALWSLISLELSPNTVPTGEDLRSFLSGDRVGFQATGAKTAGMKADGKSSSVAGNAMSTCAPLSANDPGTPSTPDVCNLWENISSSKQRELVKCLQGKGAVPIPTVLLAVYKSKSENNLEALARLITRTNQTLARMTKLHEISRAGATLRLKQI